MAAPSPLCTLHLSIDTELSNAFDGLLCSVSGNTAAASSSLSPLFSHLPPRTSVVAERAENAVAQTVVLTSLTPQPKHDGHCGASCVTSALGSTGTSVTPSSPSCFHATGGVRDVHAVLLLDAQQVPQLLPAASSPAAAHRYPPHPSGTGPLGWYLDAVVQGLALEHASITSNGTTAPLNASERQFRTAESMSAHDDALFGALSSTPQHDVVTPAAAVQVHLSLIVVPNATAALDGLNRTNVNIAAKEAATLFSAAAAWSVAYQLDSTGSLEGSKSGAARGEEGDALAQERRQQTEAAVRVSLNLCTTAPQPQQAMQMIAALATKLLKKWSAYASDVAELKGSASAAPLSTTSSVPRDAAAAVMARVMEDLKDVRPDTQRKCVPTDFHALYTSMLTEVSSFSERKTMAAVTAFPTMCQLMEYVDGVTADHAQRVGDAAALDPWDQHQQQQQQPSSSSCLSMGGVGGAVYSTNYGEQRSWNVLNEAIVEALVTEYDRA